MFRFVCFYLSGASLPVQPMELTAIGITHNSATIRWTVLSLSYDPEIYVVQYGLTADNLNMTSAMVMGTLTPMNYMDGQQGTVDLTGLNKLTTYYYRVMATNSEGPTTSDVGTFNTSVLGTRLMCMCSYSYISYSLQHLNRQPCCSALRFLVILSPIHAIGWLQQ